VITRKAFTLIEVLLAVFIIGLGSIGIFALFAGVAQQQSRTSDLTRSIAKLRDVLSVTADDIGVIAEPASALDPVFDTIIADGVWYPMFMYRDPTDPDFGYSLTVAPEQRSQFARSRFFVVDAGEEEIYSNPAVLNPSGTGYEPRDGSAPPPGPVSGFNWNSGSAINGAQVFELEHRRVHLGSVTVEIFASNTANGTSRLAATFEDTGFLTTPPADFSNAVIQSTTSPLTTITFNYEDMPWDMQSVYPVGLRGMNIESGIIQPTEWISAIRVRYARRTDRLLGLNERLNTIINPAGERQPDSGVTMLYRRTPNRRTQVLAIAYSIAPLEPRTKFVPDETSDGTQGQATNGVLRVSDGYRLAFDDARAEFYITWTDVDDALVEGDVLIVGGDLEATQASPINEQGADNPVVVTRVLTEQGEDRAYLDDSPRFRARSMLFNFDSTTPLTRVYSLRRRAASFEDGSLWELRPVVHQVLDVQ
jgi:hypothetical protein